MLRDNSTIREIKTAPIMVTRSRRLRRDGQIGLLVAILGLASLISRPMRDGVADPAGFSSTELRIRMALSDEGESAGHDLAELTGLHAMGLIDQLDNPGNRRRKPHRVNRRGAASYIAMKPALSLRHPFDQRAQQPEEDSFKARLPGPAVAADRTAPACAAGLNAVA